MFISFEGTEGVGKSTLVHAIERKFLQYEEQVVVTREPGGTPFAEKIRQLILADSTESVTDQTELLLMFAARAQHISKVILPALEQRKIVLCDRFVDASYAYQVYGRGLESKTIDALVDHFVPCVPDLTFWLDAPVSLGMQRAARRGGLDRIEQQKNDFFERVRSGYQQRMVQEPFRIKRLDATQSPSSLVDHAWHWIDLHIQSQR